MEDQDNLAEYNDAVLYDCENTDFEPDGLFYLALAQEIGGPALEIGCGTGRITIPLAKAGIEITGLDVVPGMLARAKGKAEGLGITWVQADARKFNLGVQFDFIFAAASFQHFIERSDQEAVLARVREHLAPQGIFAFSVGYPRPKQLQDAPSEEDWFSYPDEQGREVRVSGTYAYDPIRQVSTEIAHRRWQDEEGREVLQKVPLEQRWFFTQEMDALLHYNGFTVLERYGDWEKGPITAESWVMVYVCELV